MQRGAHSCAAPVCRTSPPPPDWRSRPAFSFSHRPPIYRSAARWKAAALSPGSPAADRRWIEACGADAAVGSDAGPHASAHSSSSSSSWWCTQVGVLQSSGAWCDGALPLDRRSSAVARLRMAAACTCRGGGERRAVSGGRRAGRRAPPPRPWTAAGHARLPRRLLQQQGQGAGGEGRRRRRCSEPGGQA